MYNLNLSDKQQELANNIQMAFANFLHSLPADHPIWKTGWTFPMFFRCYCDEGIKTANWMVQAAPER